MKEFAIGKQMSYMSTKEAPHHSPCTRIGFGMGLLFGVKSVYNLDRYLRRAAPANPTSPVPSRINVEGSGALEYMTRYLSGAVEVSMYVPLKN
jgi:hypothetical protein